MQILVKKLQTHRYSMAQTLLPFQYGFWLTSSPSFSLFFRRNSVNLHHLLMHSSGERERIFSIGSCMILENTMQWILDSIRIFFKKNRSLTERFNFQVFPSEQISCWQVRKIQKEMYPLYFSRLKRNNAFS